MQQKRQGSEDKKAKVDDDDVFTTAESSMNILNACAIKSIIPLKSMEINKPYKILRAHRTNTIFGERIRVETEDACIFLPQRFTTVEDHIWEALMKSETYVLNKGAHGRSYIMEFKSLMQLQDDEEKSEIDEFVQNLEMKSKYFY